MARYTATETHYTNDRLYGPGEIFDYAGIPGPHMQPFVDANGKEDEAARAAKDAAAKTARFAPTDPRYLGEIINHHAGSGTGETNGRVNGSMTALTSPLGVRVDATGQVRGITQEPEPAVPPPPAEPAAPPPVEPAAPPASP